MNLEEFATTIIPFFKERWKMYNTPPEELVGKKVISIRSGFTCSGEERQIMLVDKVNTKFVHLIPTKESIHVTKDTLGWMTDSETKHNAFIFYNE